jgi:hypothetical protein
MYRKEKRKEKKKKKEKEKRKSLRVLINFVLCTQPVCFFDKRRGTEF